MYTDNQMMLKLRLLHTSLCMFVTSKPKTFASWRYNPTFSEYSPNVSKMAATQTYKIRII
jgi:hypothetical protein